ncbi:SEL1-like repeat protein [Olivibacter sp. SA151]|uniref:SEL1-like repeat protein n=1 Tax=Olivibacter jilunii TaxID=985016 RepID=UPI003F182554
MSHRIYLYNFNDGSRIEPSRQSGLLKNPLDLLSVYGGNEDGNLMMIEWGYELPVFFYPLFTDHPFLGATRYNNPEGGIFAPAKTGVELFKALYNFIELHADKLVEDVPSFLEAKKRLFDYFERYVRYAYFHLDASDVFNMNESSHYEQGQALLSQIKKTNEIIRKAITTNDPSLLNQCPDIQDSIYGYNTFRQYFNEPVYAYGWEVIFPIDEDMPEIEEFPEGLDIRVYQRDNKFGFVHRNGHEITPAIYDLAYDFKRDETNVALVQRDGKWGMIDENGGECIACIYDEAYEFPDGASYAVVCKGQKWGYIDRQGRQPLPLIYDNALDALGNIGTVQEGGRYFLIDILSGEKCSAEYDEINILSYAPPLYEIRQATKKGLLAVTGKETVAPVYSRLEAFTDDAFLLSSKKNKALFLLNTNVLVDGCLQIDVVDYNFGIYRFFKNGAYGLCTREGLLLKEQFDSIVPYAKHETDKGWELFAFKQGEAVSIIADGTIEPLTAAQCIDYLGHDWSYVITEQQKDILEHQCGAELPVEQLFDKGSRLLEQGKVDEAYVLLKQAADQGYADAMSDLGYIHTTFEEFLDDEKGFHWYLKGAELGSAYALNGLGLCYQHGYGTDQDYAKAFAYFKQAAEAGVVYAYVNLGMAYTDGIVVEQDMKKAYQYLKRAENLGRPAYDYLGYVAKETGYYDEALSYLRQGSKEGSAYCTYLLAIMYQDGLGCRADNRKALSTFKKANEMGDINSILEIYNILRSDEELKDEEQAKEWLSKARAQGLEIP